MRVIVVVTLAFAALLIKMVTVEKGGKEMLGRQTRGGGLRRPASFVAYQIEEQRDEDDLKDPPPRGSVD